MDGFPRTNVGGVSLSRLIIGSNWFTGFSHYSVAKDKHIRNTQTSESVADILEVFIHAGIDTLMGPNMTLLIDAVEVAQQRTGQEIKLILTPFFNILPGGPPENEPEKAIAQCKEAGATICMPHQMVTDALADRMYRKIRDIDKYTALIRQYEMVPGLSTHMPEAVIYADETGADIEILCPALQRRWIPNAVRDRNGNKNYKRSKKACNGHQTSSCGSLTSYGRA